MEGAIRPPCDQCRFLPFHFLLSFSFKYEMGSQISLLKQLWVFCLCFEPLYFCAQSSVDSLLPVKISVVNSSRLRSQLCKTSSRSHCSLASLSTTLIAFWTYRGVSVKPGKVKVWKRQRLWMFCKKNLVSGNLCPCYALLRERQE